MISPSAIRGRQVSSLLSSEIDFSDLTLDSMLMDLPAYTQSASPDTSGQTIANLLESDPLLPGVLILAESGFQGVISRESFFQKTGKLYGTEIFLIRPIQKMLEAIPHQPLILPETTLISLAAKAALSRDRNLIYQPVVIENTDRSYGLISTLLLFMAQSHQLITLHNQRLFTIDSGQDISTKEAIIRFIQLVGNQEHFSLSHFVKRHSIRCSLCRKLINYSLIDIVRSFPYLNQGVVVEERMGTRTYRMYIRHRCGGELWEIPVHHDHNLEYRSQRPARIVDSYV
jgi:hypothetical protein